MLRRLGLRLCASSSTTAALVKIADSSADTAYLTQEQLDSLSPRDVVAILDRYIVGQTAAKKAVAISLRNRWRRRQITDEGLRGDILPKNILMIGPTGVGKTEISRRMARITDAPFVKVEATKYTEVGFRGKDVESMIEDLFVNGKTKARRRLERERDAEAEKAAQDIVFSAYMRRVGDHNNSSDDDEKTPLKNLTFEEFQEKLKSGELKDEYVTIDVSVTQPERKGQMFGAVSEIFMFNPPQKVTQQVYRTIAEAIPLTKVEVLNKLIDDNQVSTLAKRLTEEEGIIFIDEIDKVVNNDSSSSDGADVSAVGVQQDLLPLIEGSSVTLKSGVTIETDNILFICSGAFHIVKPSDMIAELQGRLPVRVELQALNEMEFRRILIEPKCNLLLQQKALMKTENVVIDFVDSGINAIASVTARVNSSAQNIGARRLNTIIEMVMEEYSFDSEKYANRRVEINEEVVNARTKELLGNVDLSSFNVTEKWVPESLKLPDGEPVFTDLRAKADNLFGSHAVLGPEADEWIKSEMQQHVVETGITQMTKDVAEIVDQHAQDKEQRVATWNEETAEFIEGARNEVSTLQEDLRQQNRDVDLRLREEEIAARNRLLYEHQAMEASLLRKLSSHSGVLQTVPVDKFSWTIEWDCAPQEFNVNITSLRGSRAKLRDGYYVIMASVVDRVGGKTLRFSTGRENINCSGCLPPIRFLENSAMVDRFINLGMEIRCPAPKMLHTYACLVFEVWQLRVGNYDRTDKVVGWGVWPLVDRDFRVVEGRFRLPLIRGDVDQSIDTYQHISHSLQENLKYWLGNLYFEIILNRSDHSVLKARYETIEKQHRNAQIMPTIVTHPHQKQDKLRLAKTVDDHHKLIVPKLPARLFFDDVALGNEGSQGLRRRYFGTEDLRPLNAALWEKRAMLEDERATLNYEYENSKRHHCNDDYEEADRLVREEMTRNRNHVVGNVYKYFPDVNFAQEEQLLEGQTTDKVADSHILLINHHTAIALQREFIFLGRRYRDRLRIMMNIILYDLGVNFSGTWDKSKLVTNMVYLVIALIARNVVHNVGLWLYLNILDVPLVVNSWNVLHADLRFEFRQRFYPYQTLSTMFVGFITGILIFVLFGFAFYLLLRIFQRFPYVLTRFLFWFGFAVFFDPVISAATEAAIGNTETGDAFILMNQLSKEEGGTMSGWVLTLCAYISLMILEGASLYWFACAVHLNGRVNDIYDRIMFPERSFFVPHDLEISESELREVVKEAHKFRDEVKGTVKCVRVKDFNHHYTCYFRSRLYKLLSIRSDNPDEWVSEYIDSIPLRRPRHSEKLITRNLGSYRLGKDIINFMQRHFPHLTIMSSYRIGDMTEDSYYEAELLRSVQMHSTANEDDLELRNWLKSYFKAQIDGTKPAHWFETEGNEEEKTLRTPFVINDWQLLADLIFFETNTALMRNISLRYMLHQDKASKERRSANPEEKNVYALSHFIEGDADQSTQGQEALGAIIQIYREMPAKGTKELSRVFVVTPFGSIIEPNRTSFSLLEHHTADDTEFWAHKAMETIDISDQLTMEHGTY